MQGSGGKFPHGDPITRQEMCLVLCNAFDLDAGGAGVADFPDDAVIAGRARDAVYICAAVGLVKGDDKGSFHPRNNTKRSEAERYVREALLVSPYIREAKVTQTSFEGSTIRIAVDMTTVYGRTSVYV